MTDDASDKRHTAMMHIIPADWDKTPTTFMSELRAALATIKDEGSAIDSGAGADHGDLWVTVGGVEFFVTARKSNGQLEKEGKCPPAASCGDC